MTRTFKFLAIALLAVTAVSGTMNTARAAEPQAGEGKTFDQGGVQITDVEVGAGDLANKGAMVRVHYTGWLMDGTKFDSSRDSDTPFKFSIGAREVIRGWDIGVNGMRVGGKRELIIPSKLAYGERGVPDAIPPNSTLKFEVELLEVVTQKLNWVKNKFNNDSLEKLIERGVPIIDIRRPEELADVGTIKGSYNIPAFSKNQGFITTFFPQLKKIVKKTDEFILICSNGRRAIYLGEIMSERKGYTNLYAVQKGIDKWIEHGGKVVKP